MIKGPSSKKGGIGSVSCRDRESEAAGAIEFLKADGIRGTGIDEKIGRRGELWKKVDNQRLRVVIFE